LRIEPVRRKPDLSEIECRAENGAGDPVYAQATLTVYDERNLPPGFPVINQNPDLKVIETGTKALLDCAASGNPTVNIYWVKDAMRLASNPRFSVVQGGKNRGE
jgi:netrin-G3 ligand